MKAPSSTLLGAILRPASRCSAQTRASSTGHNVSLLDKLHRRQKEAARQERLTSAQRAKTNPNLRHRKSPTSSEASEAPEAPSSLSDKSGNALHSDQARSSLPFNMTRTTTGHQLPVYQLAKGGGTKHITRLRRLSGDLTALKDDLTKALGVEGGYKNGKGEKVDAISINWQTRQVLVRGWRAPEVVAWAESRGF